MDAQIKEKWVKALRSGEYKQGSGVLRHGDSYCCLGVLCVVAGMALHENGNAVEEAYTPDSVTAGYAPIFEMVGSDLARRLASMNDRGKTFHELADCIEDHL